MQSGKTPIPVRWPPEAIELGELTILFTQHAHLRAAAPTGARGRGRDEDCSSPPAQIRTCGFPASGSCLGSNVIGLRGMGYPCSSDPWARRFGDMLVPALCPEHAIAAHPPLDRPPSPHHLRPRCHPALFEASHVLCRPPT